MKSQVSRIAAFICLTSCVAFGAEPAKLTHEQTEFFEKKIRPYLISQCYKCHSATSEKVKGGLLVDTREGLLKGGNTSPAVVPGKPEKSLLIKAIRQEDHDLAMPPKGDKLAEDVIADFEQWIKMGAPDPREGKVANAGLTVDWTKAREHWSFKPVANPPVPKCDDAKHFVQTPLDAFVLAKLQEKHLEPSPKADKRTLIRRATYDLIGLPPTPQEVAAFLADESPKAFEKVVDRLLASPRYGERWGRHWLDVARYADTTGDRIAGGRRNPLYPYAWTYRDYVINAFNKDLPYDQFIIQQIAADKLPDAEKNKRTQAALGFLTIGKKFMGNDNEVIDDQIDVVCKGVMGLTAACARCHDHKFDPIPTRDYYSLHGVFNSSREPKDEPLLVNPEKIPAYKDFQKEVAAVEKEIERYHESEAARFASGMLDKAGDYMLAVYDGTRQRDRFDSFRLLARRQGLDAELADIWLQTMKSLAKKKDIVFGPWFRFADLPEKDFAAKAPAVVQEVSSAPESAVHPLVAKVFVGKSPKSIKDVAAIYTDALGQLKQEMKLDGYVSPRAGKGRKFDMAKTQVALADANLESLRKYFFGDGSPIMPDTQMMARALGVQFRNQENAIRNKIALLQMNHAGSPARAMTIEDAPKARDSHVFIRGEAKNPGPVAPRQFLEILSGENRKPFTDGSGRLELAKSIASRDNPLTARVIVNRVWQHHFGQAIVRTVSDFGARSEPPTHPEMLDWLASYLMDNGWSLKKLHRLIVLSGVYQQDSRSNERAMQVDPTNQWLWRFNIQRLDFEEVRDTLLAVGGNLDLTMFGPPVNIGDVKEGRGKYAPTDVSSMRAGDTRRTVYAFVDRFALPEMFNTFDFANPDMSTGERIMTTVPQQALFMMNSPVMVAQVKRLLARPEIAAQQSNEGKVRVLYRLVFQRAPNAAELKLALDYFASIPNDTAKSQDTPKLQQAALINRNPKKPFKPNKQAQPVALLNAWERYAQVILLANELIYVN